MQFHTAQPFICMVLMLFGSGGSMLGPGEHMPPNLAQAPIFLIGSIVISLSRCCLPNDEGLSPKYFFVEPPLLFRSLHQKYGIPYRPTFCSLKHSLHLDVI